MNYKRMHKHYNIVGMLLFLAIMVMISGCEKKVSNSNENIIPNAANASEQPKYDTSFLGVVKEINDISKTITIYNVDQNMDVTLFYSGGTDIKDQYEQVISISQMELGEMVDAYCVSDTSKLVKMQISNKAWEYESVNKIQIDRSNKVVQIVDHKYQYNENIVVTNQEGLISLIDLNDRDELTVKGVGGKIYSIMVTKGHGYIRLTNYKDFIGGTIEVGYGIIIPVVEDMLIVAREGSYKVTMENGELVGSRNVTVTRDNEITLDMGDFRIKKEHVGTVNFVVSPEGADLYINGAIVDYTQPLELNYGEHDVIVRLAGYEDFVGILTVAAAYQTININLAEATAEVVQEDGTTSDESQANEDENVNNQDETVDSDNSQNNNNNNTNGTDITKDNTNTDTPTTTTGTTKIDNSHTISVQAPVGAKVYLNGTLKGTAPVKFTKEIGTHVITFSMDGYVTKSYTIEVVDDAENVTFTFPDMALVAE